MQPDFADSDRTITAILADDEAHVLEYVRTVLELDGFEVLGTAHDAHGAIRLVQRLRPNVAILDLYMPGGGLSAAEAIATSSPHTHVMVLSAESDGRQVVPLLRAGIDGYVVKGCTPLQLTQAIRAVLVGGVYLAPEVGRAAIDELTSRLRDETDLADHERLCLERVLDTVDNHRFVIHCQPIIDVTHGSLHAVEALARFSAEPLRSPDAWFAEASDLGLRTSLEVATAAAALDELTRLRPELRLTVNLSPDAAVSGRFDVLIPGTLPERIVLEITEHAPVRDYQRLRAALRPWRAAGARLAIDDAGGGYASLRHLLNLAPDYIKLDVDLTAHIEHDPQRQAMVRSLIAYADELGASVIAEGVESDEQLAMLEMLGTHYAQGFHIGRPMPLDDQPRLRTGEPGFIELRPEPRSRATRT